MAERLSEKWSRLIHRMGREREDRIISGETKLTVTAIFLINDNWKTGGMMSFVRGASNKVEKETLMRTLTCLAIFLAMFCILLGQSEGAEEGLVGYWKFDEGSGDTAGDSSGHNNHGTLKGDPQWVAGMIGGALKLDGVDDYVDCGADPSLDVTTGEITIAAWVKIDVFENWDGIVTKGTTIHSTYAMQMWGDGSLRCCIGCGGAPGGGLWDANTKMVAGKWLHVAYTYDGSTLSFYINGVKDSKAVAVLLRFENNNESLTLGCDFEGGDEYFDGVMDDVRIYNRGLTEKEIKRIMEGKDAAVSPSGKLAVTWGVIKER